MEKKVSSMGYKVLDENFWNAEETKYTEGGVLMTHELPPNTSLEDIAKDIILARHLDQKLNIVRYDVRELSAVREALKVGNNLKGYVIPADKSSINVGVLEGVSNPYILYPDLTRWFKDEMECVMRITKDLSGLSKKPVTKECTERFKNMLKQNTMTGGVWDRGTLKPFNDTKNKSQWFYVANFEYRKNIPLLNADDINKYTKLFLALATNIQGILHDEQGDNSPEQLSRRVRGKNAIYEVLGDNDPEEALTKAGVKGLEARTKFLLSKERGFILLPPDKAIYHQNGIGAKERKFIHRNGAEIILDGDTGKVVTDPRWRGTFNYDWHYEGIEATNHFKLDVEPWYKYGAGPNDPKREDQRRFNIK